jgi:hypothetical protein
MEGHIPRTPNSTQRHEIAALSHPKVTAFHMPFAVTPKVATKACPALR